MVSMSTGPGHYCSDGSRHEAATLIVCVRSVRIPPAAHKGFFAWIEEYRGLRERHGILLELVLDRSPRQNTAKAMPPDPVGPHEETDALVITAWASHEAFDAWIDTPDRDRLTDSDVHRSVVYGPITRYDVAGGYLNLDGLRAVAEQAKEASP
jgi:hypothetical protein